MLDSTSDERSRFNQAWHADGEPCVDTVIATLEDSTNPYEMLLLPALWRFAKRVEASNQCLAKILEVANNTLALFSTRDDGLLRAAKRLDGKAKKLQKVAKELREDVIGLNGSKGKAYDATTESKKTKNDSARNLDDPDLDEMEAAVARSLDKSSLSETDFQEQLALGKPARNVVNICLAFSIVIGVMKRVRFSDLPDALCKKIEELALEMSADVNATDSAFDVWQDVVSPALRSNASNATCDTAVDLMMALAKVNTNEKIRDAFNAEAKVPALGGGTVAEDGTVAYTTDRKSKDKANKQLRITFSILLANHIERAVFGEHLVHSGINRFSVLPAILRCSPANLHEQAGPLIWKSPNSKAYVFALPDSNERKKIKIESLCNNLKKLVEGSVTEDTESHFGSKLFLLKKTEVALVSRHHSL